MGQKNKLATEKSPYLLQHAENPVSWFPWGEEAFRKAAEENKPVFLSVGYSTCHWCHVMAHESFENEQVASMLNDAFVCVKVDREERPDIDAVYMSVCQMLTGSGGWPLSVFLTPDKKPFFAGTYFPKESRYGQLGMLDLIPRIREFWLTRKGELIVSANRIAAELERLGESSPGEKLSEPLLRDAFVALNKAYDGECGGFGLAPKFPMPSHLFFLLRFWKRDGNPEALSMVEKTLEEMRKGGIYDQLGLGFHRYSVDREWRVPHFEKMLYDQALLSMAYLEAYQATRNATYARVAREIFEYVLRDLKDPGGGFYSSEDADSEGEEGKFYLWSPEEIGNLLPSEQAEAAIRLFGIGSGAELESKTPHLSELFPRGSDAPRFEAIRERLLAARQKRVRPHRDEKILADWNGLMIAALALGGAALEKPELTEAAKNAASFILENLSHPEHGLLHRYADEEAAIPATLNDFAFFIWGLLNLYESTFQEEWLEKAMELNGKAMAEFWDAKSGGFFLTSSRGEVVLVRLKEMHDGAIPSGNAVAFANLLRLSRMSGEPALEQTGWEAARAFSGEISRAPAAYTHFLCGLDFALGPNFEVILAGDLSSPELQEMALAMRQTFLPNKVVLLNQMRRISPSAQKEAPAAHVCAENRCFPPVKSPSELLVLLGEKSPINKESTRDRR